MGMAGNDLDYINHYAEVPRVAREFNFLVYVRYTQNMHMGKSKNVQPIWYSCMASYS